MYGFYRMAVSVPKLKVADVAFNTAEIIRCAREAETQGAAAVLFPELSITGASCGDLFFQHTLLNAAENSVFEIANEFKDSSLLIVVGLPLLWQSGLYNCATLLQKGKVLAFAPKTFLTSSAATLEKRYFADGWELMANSCCFVKETEKIPFSAQIQLSSEKIRMEVGFGLDRLDSAAVPPAVMFHLAASTAVAGQRKKCRNMLKSQSLSHQNIALYASAGVHESTTDGVYEGTAVIAENGDVLAENKGFLRESEILYADVDLDSVRNPGLNPVYQMSSGNGENEVYPTSEEPLRPIDKLQYRIVNSLPFLPDDSEKDDICREIFQKQIIIH